MSTDVSTGGQASTGVAASTGAGGSTAQAMGWGNDWRTRLAGGTTDAEKELKRLERFQGPEDIYKSFRSLETRMSNGELKTVLPKGATPEEAARWRQDNGLPAKAEDYKINMPAGRTPPKDDDAFLKTFLKSAHDSNFSQGQVDTAIGTFYAEVDRLEEAANEGEKVAIKATEDALRMEWQGDYRTNMAMANALLDRAPSGFKDRFMKGYLSDRTPIRASPDAWKWLVQLEREINPAATVVPGAGGDVTKTLADELLGWKAKMQDQNSDYWKGPKAEANQARYRQLLEAQEKIKAKAGATA